MPLERRGWETTVALPDEPGTAAARLAESGVETLQLPLGRLRADPRLLGRYARELRPTVRALEQAIERTGADVVVIAGLINPHAAFAARRAGSAVLWQIVDAMAPPPLRRLGMRFVRSHADAVTFDADPLLDVHRARERLSVPLFLTPPPVDAELFVPSSKHRVAVRSELGIPEDAQVVGTVSPLIPVKGLETFLGAAARIAAVRPQTHFVVVGGPSESHRAYAERLQRQAEELGLPHPVVFTGERSDVERWYPAFDIHLNTSLTETTTTTAIEAQACGLPVIATRVGAIHEVVEDGVSGILVEPQRDDLVAEAALRLLENDQRRAVLGRAGRESVAARYGVEAAADVQARALDAALDHARGRFSGR